MKSVREKVLERGWAYVRVVHPGDPAGNPADVKGMAKYIGVARGTIYNHLNSGDPEVEELLQALEEADAIATASEGWPGPAVTAEDAPVSDAELEREILDKLKTVAYQMRGFVTDVEAAETTDEAPLYMADLDAGLKRWRAMYLSLEQPCEEWMRRRTRSAADALPDSASSAQLDFADMPDDEEDDAD